jgi:ApaG protein
MSAKLLRITISAVTKHMESRSDPESSQYAFGYAITLINDGDVPVRLLRRHWLVKSDDGHTQEVQGEGVVGEQPRLIPGKSFKYTS